MAKNRGNPDASGKIKFRFIEFEMDSSSPSLEEGLKSIAAALTRSSASAAPAKIIREVTDQTGLPTSLDPSSDEAEEEEVAAVKPSPRKTVTAKKVTPRKILEDFKLDDVKPTLKEFATGKNPNSDLKKYLVIAFWAKTYKKMEELSPDHFFTAYRALGWSTPKDPAQPIRDLVNPRVGRFSSASVPGNGKINHIGEQVVIDLGSSGSQ